MAGLLARRNAQLARRNAQLLARRNGKILPCPTMSDCSSSDMSDCSSSEDEVPVAQLLARRNGKRNGEDASLGPEQDRDGEEGTEGMEGSLVSDESEDSPMKDPDYEDDAQRIRKFLNRQRLERGRARAVMQVPHFLPISPKTTIKKPSKEQIVGWENDATQRMMEKTNCEDLLAACMLLVHVRLHPWESEMSMFFFGGTCDGKPSF